MFSSEMEERLHTSDDDFTPEPGSLLSDSDHDNFAALRSRTTHSDALPTLTLSEQPEAKTPSQQEFEQAKASILSDRNLAEERFTTCSMNLRLIRFKGKEETHLFNRSFINAELFGGPESVKELVERTNSNLWLYGSQEELRITPTGHPYERWFDFVNTKTGQVTDSLHYSILPESRVLEDDVRARRYQNEQNQLRFAKQSNRAHRQ